jgi:hypothetical protein
MSRKTCHNDFVLKVFALMTRNSIFELSGKKSSKVLFDMLEHCKHFLEFTWQEKKTNELN